MASAPVAAGADESVQMDLPSSQTPLPPSASVWNEALDGLLRPLPVMAAAFDDPVTPDTAAAIAHASTAAATSRAGRLPLICAVTPHPCYPVMPGKAYNSAITCI